MANLEFKDIRDAANGHWDILLRDLAGMGDAVETASRRKHVACPVHGGTDGFRLFPDFADKGAGICNTCGPIKNGFDMLVWVNGWDIKRAFEEVAEYLNITEASGPRPHVERPKVEPSAEELAQQKAKEEKLANALKTAWTEAYTDIVDEAAPMMKYIKKRGLDIKFLPPSMRLHPSMPYYEATDDKQYKLIGSYPTILSVVVDANAQPVTLHRTYLTPEGDKAPVEKAKKLMSARASRALTGGCIRLGEPDKGVLSVCEGIETGLAIMQVTRTPVWCSMSATLLAKMSIPDSVHTVVIWADLDAKFAGQIHAQQLAERLSEQGKTVRFYLPPGPIPTGAKGVDWLDVLNNEGSEGFPRIPVLRRALTPSDTQGTVTPLTRPVSKPTCNSSKAETGS